MEGYDHKSIEQKWKKVWKETELYKTSDEVAGKENEYVLVEFPYPSGDLHVGHWYAFAITDIYARYQRLKGKNVLFPVGFDAFGLPAENAAIKRGLNPREWTFQNIEVMRHQLDSMGASFDWSREIVSCSPEYYKWTQWLFIKLFEAGLVEKKISLVNWDPIDKTVLANEQVLADGTAERSGALVEKKEMEQWSIKITKYADRLIDDLDALEWPNQIKEAQKNWIGRSSGAEIDFKIDDSDVAVKVFTTRPDTLFGVTYVVLAPEHKLVEELISKVSNKSAVEEYIEVTKRKLERERLIGVSEKTGVVLEGVFAINPATNEKVPVFIADYVLANYGTGAVMAVPAHDERDFEFAEKFGLPIKKVVIPRFVDNKNPHVEGKEVVFRKGVLVIVRNPKTEKYLCLEWPNQGWTTFISGGLEENESVEEAAIREVYEETGYKNLKFIKMVSGPVQVEFFAAHKNLNRISNSWCVLCELENEEQDEVSVDEKNLHTPIWLDKSEINREKMMHSELDYVLDLWKSGEKEYAGEGILINSGEFDGLQSEEAKEKIVQKVGGEMKSTYRLRDWTVSRQRYWGCPIPMINCASCGSVPEAEENLPVILPEISDYLPRDDGKSPLAKATDWMHTKCPKCGGDAERETDTLDTFVDSSWYYLRYLDSNNSENFSDIEKIKKWMPVNFYSGGSEHTTMHVLFARFFNKALFDLKLSPVSEPFSYRLNRGLILGPDGNKMSKSKGNVINPDIEVEKLGADTVRTYLAFIGPYNEPGSYPWDPNGIVGARRFLERIFKISDKIVEKTPESVEKVLHKAIKKVEEDMQRLKFNTAISELMILTNEIFKSGISTEDAKIVAKLISPIAPHLAEEMWQKLGGVESIHKENWPVFDPEMLVSDTITVPVQINGKVRAQVVLPSEMPENEVRELVLADETVQKWIAGSEVKKIIYIPNKLVSIVV
ncbi:MAG: class I tRNA ligase family protein [Candidatus Paceibacterota bacterium]